MKKILFLAVALIMSVCSMWADIAPGTYIIRPYSAQSKCLVPSDVWFRSSDNQVKGPDKVVYTTDQPTSENGGYWVIANATAGGGFTITPENAKFVDTAGQHGYLNPWNGSSNVGCWTTTDGGDRWDITQVEGNVYTFESGEKAGNYFYYNSGSSNLQYNVPGTPNETNRFVLEKVATPFPGAGTHYLTFKGKDSGRPQYLYHDLTQADGFTLASTTAGTTNAYIWRAVCDGTDMTVRNGQGQVIGMRGKSSAGVFYTDVLTYTSHSDCYYLKPKNATGMKSDHNCLNQSNSSSYANSEGTKTLTSWSTTSGPNANDNHWYVTAVTDKDFYDVVITGGTAASDVNYSVASYANYSDQKAADGGFFVVAKGTVITVDDVTVTNAPTGKRALVTVEDHRINISFEEVSEGEAIDVTYTVQFNGETISEETVKEYIGTTPTYQLNNPSYVSVEGMPNTISLETTSVTLETALNNEAPFMMGATYNISLKNGTNIYWLNDNNSGKLNELRSADGVTESSLEQNSQWIIGGDWLNGFTIKNVATEKYVAAGDNHNNGTAIKLGETAEKYQLVKNSTGWRFKVENTYIAHTSHGDHIASYWSVDSYAANYVFFTLVPEPVSTSTMTVSFVTNTGAKYMLNNNEGTLGVINYPTAAPATARFEMTLWNNGRYTFKNGEKFLGYNRMDSEFNSALNYWDVNTLEGVTSDYITETVPAGSVYLHVNKRSTSNNLEGVFVLKIATKTFDNASGPFFRSDYTSALLLEEYVPKDWAPFDAKLAALKQYPIGEGVGQYGDLDLSEYNLHGVEEALSYYQLDSDNGDESMYDADMEQMDYILDNLTLNQPKAGKFYTFMGSGSSANKYMKANTAGANLAYTSANAEADASCIFYLDEEGHLLSYSTGLYTTCATSNGSKCKLGTLGNSSTYTFGQALNGAGKDIIGAYYIGVGSQWIQPWSNIQIANNGHKNDNQSGWYLEEVTELPVAFHENGQGFATLYAPVALAIPEGVKAYTMSNGTEGRLHADEVETTIPANTGVVLEGTAGETESFVITTGGTAEAGVLTGTVPAIAKVDGSYVFSIVGGNEGFYQFGGTELAGFKAYYKPTVANVQGFVIDFDGITTAINAAEQTQSQKVSFDLQGRRVSKAVRGLFIQNGVKVIK